MAYASHVEDGGLMSYGIDLRENYRRGAIYVDKILKGAKPGDLPVELPTKLELVINLKTARQLGISFPPSIMVQADEILGPFPDYTGKGWFACANSYQRRLRIWLAIGHEHAR